MYKKLANFKSSFNWLPLERTFRTWTSHWTCHHPAGWPAIGFSRRPLSTHHRQRQRGGWCGQRDPSLPERSGPPCAPSLSSSMLGRWTWNGQLYSSKQMKNYRINGPPAAYMDGSCVHLLFLYQAQIAVCRRSQALVSHGIVCVIKWSLQIINLKSYMP